LSTTAFVERSILTSLAPFGVTPSILIDAGSRTQIILVIGNHTLDADEVFRRRPFSPIPVFVNLTDPEYLTA
jgi:hypothetical protein